MDQCLASGEETAVEFKFDYPARPMWMRVRLDPNERIDEFCEANNESVERTDARPIQFGYDPNVLAACLSERKINHVGSLSYYDWLLAQKLRMDVMLREAVWPTTGPYGVEEAYRVDAMIALNDGPWEDQPYERQMVYFDGGFPVNEPVDLMAVDAAIIHEFGHTILSQPDLYGYGVKASNVFLTDGEAKPYAGTPVLPVIEGDELMPFSPGVSIACGGAYPSLMDSCQLWLHPSQAGHILHYKGYRQDRFWGTQGRLVPNRANWLLIYDRDDRPLAGATVYVYHVAQAPVQDSGAKYFADQPKFVGRTDDDGRFVFPHETDPNWDDPETDEVDGAIQVWNPFGGAKSDVAFTPNVWTVEGLLLLKIVVGRSEKGSSGLYSSTKSLDSISLKNGNDESLDAQAEFGREESKKRFFPPKVGPNCLFPSGAQEEFQFMDLMAFNEAFLSGRQVLGKYRIRTNLPCGTGRRELMKDDGLLTIEEQSASSASNHQSSIENHQSGQDALATEIRRVNHRPVAVAPAEMTVRCGQEFEIDGSKSYDPEGRPLHYRWGDAGQWLQRDRHQGPVARLKAPDKPGTVEYKFWVLNGVRCSEPAIIKVQVED